MDELKIYLLDIEKDCKKIGEIVKKETEEFKIIKEKRMTNEIKEKIEIIINRKINDNVELNNKNRGIISSKINTIDGNENFYKLACTNNAYNYNNKLYFVYLEYKNIYIGNIWLWNYMNLYAIQYIQSSIVYLFSKKIIEKNNKEFYKKMPSISKLLIDYILEYIGKNKYIFVKPIGIMLNILKTHYKFNCIYQSKENTQLEIQILNLSKKLWEYPFRSIEHKHKYKNYGMESYWVCYKKT